MTYAPVGFRELDDALWGALNAFPASTLLAGASKDVFQGQDALALPPVPKGNQARLVLRRVDWSEINAMNRPGLQERFLEPAAGETPERWTIRQAPLWFRIQYEIRHVTRSFDLDQILAQWVDTVALRHRSYLQVREGVRVIVLREPRTMNLDLVEPGSNGASPATYEKVRFFTVEAQVDLEAPVPAPIIRAVVFGLTPGEKLADETTTITQPEE